MSCWTSSTLPAAQTWTGTSLVQGATLITIGMGNNCLGCQNVCKWYDNDDVQPLCLPWEKTQLWGGMDWVCVLGHWNWLPIISKFAMFQLQGGWITYSYCNIIHSHFQTFPFFFFDIAKATTQKRMTIGNRRSFQYGIENNSNLRVRSPSRVF